LPDPSETAASLPALLRAARRTYASAVRDALSAAGYDDVPRNGSYVLGAMARSEVALSRIIADLGVSKQAAGQLVDTLVARGYLHRSVDPEDRRRLTLGLTERGQDAATVIRTAVAGVDSELAGRLGEHRLDEVRGVLAALAELGDETRS
jgi:DNA-binding MarR family transcriptional regulator